MIFRALAFASVPVAHAPIFFNTKSALSIVASPSANALPSTSPRHAATQAICTQRFELGEDPAGAKAESQSRAEETFGNCLKSYLGWQRARVRQSSFAAIERHLVKNLAPLHRLRVDKIDRRAIALQLGRIANRGNPVQANRTRASLSKFLNWAMGEGLVEANAALLTNKLAENKPRDRYLSKAEIHTLWHGLPNGDFGDILRILLLTGQREREISDLRWDEIDFASGVIDLPPHRTKKPRRHTVPMSPAVRAILEARPQQGRAFVFGTGAKGFSGWSRAKKRLDDSVKISPWRIHDLRRSCATGMAEIGVSPHVIEAILNHVSGTRAGIAGIYNRSTYETEKASALLRWAEHIAAIADGRTSNVTPLKRA